MSGVLVDSSVWVAHFKIPNPALQALLADDRVLIHPLVVLELACGTPPEPRQETLRIIQMLRQVRSATAVETVAFVEREQLYGQGCGAVDVSLLAGVLITPLARLWTLDKPLLTMALRLNVAYQALSA